MATDLFYKSCRLDLGAGCSEQGYCTKMVKELRVIIDMQ